MTHIYAPVIIWISIIVISIILEFFIVREFRNKTKSNFKQKYWNFETKLSVDLPEIKEDFIPKIWGNKQGEYSWVKYQGATMYSHITNNEFVEKLIIPKNYNRFVLLYPQKDSKTNKLYQGKYEFELPKDWTWEQIKDEKYLPKILKGVEFGLTTTQDNVPKNKKGISEFPILINGYYEIDGKMVTTLLPVVDDWKDYGITKGICKNNCKNNCSDVYIPEDGVKCDKLYMNNSLGDEINEIVGNDNIVLKGWDASSGLKECKICEDNSCPIETNGRMIYISDSSNIYKNRWRCLKTI